MWLDDEFTENTMYQIKASTKGLAQVQMGLILGK